MTAPAPVLLPRTAPPAPTRDAVPQAAERGAQRRESAGFAAHLAREVPAPLDRHVRASSGKLDTRKQPNSKPDGNVETQPEPEAAKVSGKALPPNRQKSAAIASPVAFSLRGEQASPDEKSKIATDAPGDQPLDVLAPLPFAPPGSAVVLPAPTTPTVGSAAPIADTMSADSLQTGGPAVSAISPATGPQPAQHTSATAASILPTNLVLERVTAAPAIEEAPAVPDQAAPEAGAQVAARAQPSTLAALTGTVTAERVATRKLRLAADTALPGAKAAAPEVTAALAFGTASTAMTPAAPAAAASPVPATPQPISFDQLVDSIARARDGIDQGGPVAVALHHGEFGRVSLRIESDGAGLSVMAASSDPGFAPAVAAAHAAASATLEAPRSEAGARDAARSQNLSQTGGQSGSQSSGHALDHSGQHRDAPRAQPRHLARSEAAAAAPRRSGIFA